MREECIFDRCGGFATVGNIVMAFYEKVLRSNITGPYFVGVDISGLMVHQTKFVSSIMGGLASFADDTLQQKHHRLGVSIEAFHEMARLSRTLEGFEIEGEDVETLMREIQSRSELVVKIST